MFCVSILIPMAAFNEKVDIVAEVSKMLKIPESSIQSFEVGTSAQRTEFAVKVPSLNLNLNEINLLISENSRLKEELLQLKKDIIHIEESISCLDSFQQQQESVALKKEIERLTELLKSNSANMAYIKQEAQMTIDNLIQNLSIELKDYCSQTESHL